VATHPFRVARLDDSRRTDPSPLPNGATEAGATRWFCRAEAPRHVSASSKAVWSFLGDGPVLRLLVFVALYFFPNVLVQTCARAPLSRGRRIATLHPRLRGAINRPPESHAARPRRQRPGRDEGSVHQLVGLGAATT